MKPSLNTHSPKTCDVGAKICGNGGWQNSVAQIARSKDKSDLRIMLSLDKLFLVLWFGTLNAEWELCNNCLNRDAFGGRARVLRAAAFLQMGGLAGWGV